MDDMIERVANAIAAVDDQYPSQHHYKMAFAAIAAMRDHPTTAMLNEGFRKGEFQNDLHDLDDVLCCWHAMFDAALADTKKNAALVEAADEALKAAQCEHILIDMGHLSPKNYVRQLCKTCGASVYTPRPTEDCSDDYDPRRMED